MAEALERIYQLVPAPEAGPFMSRRVEYVRADLVAARVREAVRTALDAVAHDLDRQSEMQAGYWWAQRVRDRIARLDAQSKETPGAP